MKTRTIIIIVIAILLLIGLAYYFLVYRPSQKEKELLGTSGNNTSPALPPNNNPITPPTPPIVATFKPGDSVYLNVNNTSNEIFVYTSPVYSSSDTSNRIGKFRSSWYGVQSIGTFVEQTGSTGFIKVKLTDFQVYKPFNSSTIEKISGDYFISSSLLSKTPY